MSQPVNSQGKTVSVDPRCWDLAELFLAEFIGEGSTEADIADLAEFIQSGCEDMADMAAARKEALVAPAGTETPR